MSELSKITDRHRQRRAVVYVRQSTPGQVERNTESAAEVGLRHVGVILALEVSRLARSSADWHQLLNLCALTGTLIADADGIYSPGEFNDRLLLGLKGTMSEAELHLIRSGCGSRYTPANKAHSPSRPPHSDKDAATADRPGLPPERTAFVSCSAVLRGNQCSSSVPPIARRRLTPIAAAQRRRDAWLLQRHCDQLIGRAEMAAFRRAFASSAGRG